MLRRHEVGRVAIATPVGPRIVPVTYFVQNGDVYFRTTPFSELAFCGRGSDLAFEVDEIDEGSSSQHGACVVAIGRAQTLDHYDERLHPQSHNDPKLWTDGRRTLYFQLRIRDVTGKRVG